MKALELVKHAQVLPENLKSKIDNMLPSASPVDHLANIINTIQAEAKAIKMQELNLAGQRKSLELLIEMAERSVMSEMADEGLCEIEGQLVKYAIKLNPHKLIIEDEKLIPDEYKKTVTTIELRKDAIKDELKLGAEIAGCKLVQDSSLQLKTVK